MDHTFYLTALALTFIFSFVLGIFTILLNPRSKVHWLWFFTTMGVSIWSGLLLVVIGLKMNNDQGVLLTRFLHIGALLLIIFFLHFLLQFLRKMREYIVILTIGYFITFIFSIIVITTNWIVAGVTPMMGFDVWLDPGKVFWLLVIYFFIYSAISIHLLYSEYNRSDGLLKKQIFFVLLAAIIGLGGGATNFFPQTINIYPFGTFVIFLYPILITYGMFLPQVKIKF